MSSSAPDEGPCAILMVGAREEDEKILYPRSDLALRHGAGVEVETTSPRRPTLRSIAPSPGARRAGTRCPGRETTSQPLPATLSTALTMPS